MLALFLGGLGDWEKYGERHQRVGASPALWTPAPGGTDAPVPQTPSANFYGLVLRVALSRYAWWSGIGGGLGEAWLPSGVLRFLQGMIWTAIPLEAAMVQFDAPDLQSFLQNL